MWERFPRNECEQEFHVNEATQLAKIQGTNNNQLPPLLQRRELMLINVSYFFVVKLSSCSCCCHVARVCFSASGHKQELEQEVNRLQWALESKTGLAHCCRGLWHPHGPYTTATLDVQGTRSMRFIAGLVLYIRLCCGAVEIIHSSACDCRSFYFSWYGPCPQ